MQLQGKKVAILAEELYEDTELWYPYHRMREAGADVKVVGAVSSPDVVGSKYGYPAKIHLRASEANPDDFDAVIVPGGYAPDRLRRCEATLGFVKKLFDQNKVVAAICHAGWVLVSAGVLKGKRVTSYFAIKDDMMNAGADWVDEDVVVDGNLITSRCPDDLPAFCREIIRVLC
jgi:protease I